MSIIILNNTFSSHIEDFIYISIDKIISILLWVRFGLVIKHNIIHNKGYKQNLFSFFPPNQRIKRLS